MSRCICITERCIGGEFLSYGKFDDHFGDKEDISVDGSRLELPNNTEVVEAFGRTNKQPDAKPLGIVSVLLDVVNKVVLDSSINPADASENHLAFYHLGKVRHGDLVILDRGYKCLWLMLGIVQKGLDLGIEAMPLKVRLVKVMLDTGKKTSKKT